MDLSYDTTNTVGKYLRLTVFMVYITLTLL
jgi:hypothetical protein